MAAPSNVSYIVRFVERLIRDTANDKWSPDEIYSALLTHETIFAGEAVWWPNQLKTVYGPSTFVCPKVGFLASDAILNINRDGSGTNVTADTIDSRNGRFRFNTAQTYDYLFVHGSAYNPFFAAADLIETHPDAHDISGLSSYAVFNYRIQFARKVPYADQLRRQGAGLNQIREAGLVEGLSVPVIDDLLTNEFGFIWK